jgi:hypothetical protein
VVLRKEGLVDFSDLELCVDLSLPVV